MKRVIPVGQPGDVTIYLPDPPEDEQKKPEPAVSKQSNKAIKIMFVAAFVMFAGLIAYSQLKQEPQEQIVQSTIITKTDTLIFENGVAYLYKEIQGR